VMGLIFNGIFFKTSAEEAHTENNREPDHS